MSAQFSLETQLQLVQNEINNLLSQQQGILQSKNSLTGQEQVNVPGRTFYALNEQQAVNDNLLKQLRTQLEGLNLEIASRNNKTTTDIIRQESRLDTTPTIVQQGQTTENQSWLPLLLIGLGFLVLAN